MVNGGDLLVGVTADGSLLGSVTTDGVLAFSLQLGAEFLACSWLFLKAFRLRRVTYFASPK